MNLRKRRDAVSSVISVMLVLTIFFTSITTIFFWGMPAIERVKIKNQSESTSNSFTIFCKDINDLLTLDASNTIKKDIFIESGSLNIDPVGDRLVLWYSFDKNYDFNVSDLDLNDGDLKDLTIDMNKGVLDSVSIYWINDTCFLPGTKISLNDGSVKNIEDIGSGDIVLSFDEINNRFTFSKVEYLIKNDAEKMPEYYCVINDDLCVTPNHILYANDKWKKVDDIKIGDCLFNKNNEKIFVSSIENIYSKSVTYDLGLEDNICYFADDFLAKSDAISFGSQPRIIKNTDGTYTKHYVLSGSDSKDEYVPGYLDEILVKDEYFNPSLKGTYDVFFKKTLCDDDKTVVILNDDYLMSFVPGSSLCFMADDGSVLNCFADKKSSNIQVDDNIVSYPGCYGDGFDLNYIYSQDALKEELIIDNKELLPLDFSVSANANLVLKHETKSYKLDSLNTLSIVYGQEKTLFKKLNLFEDNTVITDEEVFFIDNQENIVFCLPEIYAWDKTGDASKIKLSRTLNMNQDGSISVYIQTPCSWLYDENRVYPVTIDPTYTFSDTINNKAKYRITAGVKPPGSPSVIGWLDYDSTMYGNLASVGGGVNKWNSAVCFLAGTKISMADGSYRNIEDITIGEMVKSYDEQTGRIVKARVTGKMAHEPSEMDDYYLVINDVIRITGNHPVYVNNAWKDADCIHVGDFLYTEKREDVKVKSVEKVYNKVATYNLEVSEFNNYFAEGLLVHNKQLDISSWANLLYKFKINEPENDITQLDLTWKGYDTMSVGGGLYLYIWDGSSWIQWASDTTSRSSIQTYSKSYTSGITDYIDSNGYLYLSVAGDYKPACCFPAGTKISMADGSYKNIEEIKTGENILSYDIDVSNIITVEVLEPIIRMREGVYDINDGLLSPTDDHPLFVKKADGRKGWAAINPTASSRAYHLKDEIMQLEVRDKLFTENEEWIEIFSIDFRPGNIKTYTLDVSDDNTYFANKMLTHNICTVPESFKEGTEIKTDHKSSRNIESLNEGDKILSYDTEKNCHVENHVKDVHVSLKDNVYSLNNGLLYLTDNHPIYTKKPDGRCVWSAINPDNAEKGYDLDSISILNKGDKLYTYTGEWVEIFSIEKLSGVEKVCTLSLSNAPYTFFADGILAYGQRRAIFDEKHRTLYEDYVEVKVTYTPPDSSPPTPNPLTWATAPYETSISSISMVATTASDPSIPIYYWFDFYSSPTSGSGGSDSSSWQTGTSYTDSGLQENHCYGYRCKAKDNLGNQGSYSTISYDYTDIGAPTNAEFSFPSARTNSSLSMSVTQPPNAAVGNTGVYFDYYDSPTGGTGGSDKDWSQTYSYTDSGLEENQQYRYRCQFRNGDANPSGWCPSLESAYTLANPPANGQLDVASYGATWILWRVVDVDNNPDAGSTDGYFEIVTDPGGGSSGLSTSDDASYYYFNDTGLTAGQEYGMKARYDNYDGVDTTYCSEVKQTTLSSNNPPAITDISPDHPSTGININPILDVTINEPEGDEINISWYWTTDISTFYLIGTNNSGSNNPNTTYYMDNSNNFSDYEQKYYWKIIVDDGINSNEYIYYFTTKPRSGTPDVSLDSPYPVTSYTSYYTDSKYSFLTPAAVDPEGDDIFYNLSWGDGTYSGWLGPYLNNTKIPGEGTDETEANHTWINSGVYEIRYSVKDDKDSLVSGWSKPYILQVEHQNIEPEDVYTTKTKSITNPNPAADKWELDSTDIPNNLEGTVRIDLFNADYPMDNPAKGNVPFGRIWIFDLGRLTHVIPSSAGSVTKVLENGAVFSVGPSYSSFDKKPNMYVNREDNSLFLNIMQIRSSEGLSGGSGTGTYELEVQVDNNFFREPYISNVYNLKLKISGDLQDTWCDFIEDEYQSDFVLQNGVFRFNKEVVDRILFSSYLVKFSLVNIK